MRTSGTAPLALALLASLLPGPGLADGSVVLFPTLGRPTQVTVTGRALAAAPERHPGASPLERNVRRLAAKSREGAAVEVRFAGQVRRVVSGDDGFFEASFAAASTRPFPTGPRPVRAECEGAAADGRVLVVPDEVPFLLVSDFDDTVAVTDVAHRREVVRTVLLEDADTQAAVPGMAALYRCLVAAIDPPTSGVVISGSPVELGPRLEAFLARHDFPPLGLQLRRLGLRTLSGYKEPALRQLLSHFPQPVVLVGDSGERDPEIYAALRAEFPGRVLAILIRDVGGARTPGRFEGMTLFHLPAEAARAAAAAGLADQACVERAFLPAGR